MTNSQYYYNKNKSLGLCVDCGARKAAPNRVRCKKCLIKRSNRECELKRKRKERAMLHGLCTDCLVEFADEGYKTCQKCRDKSRNRLIQWCMNKSKE